MLKNLVCILDILRSGIFLSPGLFNFLHSVPLSEAGKRGTESQAHLGKSGDSPSELLQGKLEINAGLMVKEYRFSIQVKCRKKS